MHIWINIEEEEKCHTTDLVSDVCLCLSVYCIVRSMVCNHVLVCTVPVVQRVSSGKV